MSTTTLKEPENPPSIHADCSLVNLVSPVQLVAELANGKRPETGAMQFGNDWPGVFIRGDDALWMASNLGCLLRAHASGDFAAVRLLLRPPMVNLFERLGSTLDSCRIG